MEVLAGLSVSDSKLLIALVVLALCIIRTLSTSDDSGNGSSNDTEEEKGSSGNSKSEIGDPTFEYPAIEPFTDDINLVKPIPYRPFKWGDYHVTMGIRSMLWNEWIELDQRWADYHRITQLRLQTRGNQCVLVEPAKPGLVDSGHAPAIELVYELAEYLCRRFPDMYGVTRRPPSNKGVFGWYGEPQIMTITIKPLRVTYNLEDDHPLKIASLLVQEDFALMMEGNDGRYYLQAGAVSKPGFWRLMDKIGMPLDEIHTSGNVPQFKSKLQLSMERFFRRMAVDKPVVRNNYFFQVVKTPAPGAELIEPLVKIDPTEIAWSRTMHGYEDKTDFERSALIREDVENINASHSQTDVPLDPSMVYLRTERQTLRRLPRTGAIAFTIRVYQTPVVDLAKEPGVPGRLASAIRGWTEDVALYKDLFAYKDIVQFLDRAHADQLERGIVGPEDRNSAYPF